LDSIDRVPIALAREPGARQSAPLTCERGSGSALLHVDAIHA
jgi:hypothetical protein